MTQNKGSILAIGECMVELAPRGDETYNRNFAGDTFNSAWYLKRVLPAGWQVAYSSAVGTDTISDQMLAFMDCAGIDTAMVRRIADRTVGLYMIELANGERSFSYWRSQSAAKLLAEDAGALRAALEGRTVVVFSGITLAILSPEHRETLLSEIAHARAKGVRVVFDPNMRARLWPDAETMRNAVMAAAAVSDIVLPSFDEDQREFGDDDPEATIARYAGKGATTVVVKNGAGTVHALHEGRHVVFEPKPVDTVVDSTAAGDSFNAGFLAALIDGAPFEAALARGSALAGQVVQKRGALVEVSLTD